MTWVKLDDRFAIQPRWDSLSVEAFATHVVALCDCAMKLTDGNLTTKAVRRLPIVDDPMAAAEELVTAGIWERTPTGFLIVDYLKDQESASLIEERIETKRAYDREFQRDRHRASRQGMRVDEYRAKQAAAAGVTVGQWLEQQRLVRASDENRSPTPDLSSPLHSRPVGEGEERGLGSGSPEGSPDPVGESEEQIMFQVDRITFFAAVDPGSNGMVEVTAGIEDEWLVSAGASPTRWADRLVDMACRQLESAALERPEVLRHDLPEALSVYVPAAYAREWVAMFRRALEAAPEAARQ